MAEKKCAKCGKEDERTRSGKRICRECLMERRRVYALARYYRLKEQGICPSCGWSMEPGRSKCRACMDKAKPSLKKYRERLRKEHRCTNCGTQLPEDYWWVMCEACRERQAVSYKRIKDQRRAEHRCTACGAKLPEGSEMKRCEACRRKAREEYGQERGARG